MWHNTNTRRPQVDLIETQTDQTQGEKPEVEQEEALSAVDDDSLEAFVGRLSKTPHGSFSDLLREERDDSPENDSALPQVKLLIFDLKSD